jgi:hypothetical protein
LSLASGITFGSTQTSWAFTLPTLPTGKKWTRTVNGNVQCYIFVSACDNDGDCHQSQKQIEITYPPDVPVGVVTSEITGGIKLAWIPASGASGYKVYYGTSSGNYPYFRSAGSAMSINITLSEGTYYFVVSAYNANGETYSSEAVGTYRKPAVPTGLSGSAGYDYYLTFPKIYSYMRQY